MIQDNLLDDKQEASDKLASCSLGKELVATKDRLSVLASRVRKGAEYLRNGSVPPFERIKAQALFSDLCDELVKAADGYIGIITDAEISIMGRGSKLQLSARSKGKVYHFVPAKTWDSRGRLEITPSDLVFLNRVQRLFGKDISEVLFLTGEQDTDMKKLFSGEQMKDEAMYWLD